MREGLRCEFYKDLGSLGDEFLFSAEMIPRCGEDFCEYCSECLECYGWDPCSISDNGEHLWVKYVENVEEAIRIVKEYEGRIDDPPQET